VSKKTRTLSRVKSEFRAHERFNAPQESMPAGVAIEPGLASLAGLRLDPRGAKASSKIADVKRILIIAQRRVI